MIRDYTESSLHSAINQYTIEIGKFKTAIKHLFLITKVQELWHFVYIKRKKEHMSVVPRRRLLYHYEHHEPVNVQTSRSA